MPVSLTRDYVYGAWSAKIMQTNQESVRLQIKSPADAVVGRCHFYVETKTSVPGVEKETDFRYQHPEEIIMLFNPWCKGETYCCVEYLIVFFLPKLLKNKENFR